MQRLALVVVSLVVVGGCQQDNPESCELPSNAGMGVCPPIDAMPDTTPPPECAMNSECTHADKAVCDTTLNGGTCVQCTTASQVACKAQSLACVNDVCAPCTRHADCVDSNVCMPDGTCAKESDVAYVDGGGTDQMMCGRTMQCTKIEKAAMTGKSILKITGTLKDRATLNDATLLILADPGAMLTPMQNGAALDLRGSSKIQIYDLEISHGPGDGIALDDNAEAELTNVHLVNNTADGARVDGGHLTCTHCTIAQNTGRGISVAGAVLTISRSEIKQNLGGGISIPSAGTFQIVGNVIFGNGAGNAQVGGIQISVPGDVTNRIDFNSISRNNATLGTALGINCISGTALTAKYNVIWDNGAAAPFDGTQVNVSNCSYALSNIGPVSTATPTNFNKPPSFKDEAGGDLHLAVDSQVRKLAQPPAADLSGLAALDIDGDSRGSVIMVDLGADQTPP